MSYPWTRVPKDAPPLDIWQLRLLPLADLFMGLMWSRPGGLSLRTTWVTPATLGLAVAVVIVVGIPGLGAIAYGATNHQLLVVVGGLVATAFVPAKATTLTPLAIPATLHDSLTARLDRLSPVKEIAQIGAAIGREFTYRLLEAVSPIKGEALQEALRQLMEAESWGEIATP